MSTLFEFSADQLIARVTENLAPVLESYQQALGESVTAEIDSKPSTWSARPSELNLAGPGLLVQIESGDQSMLALIPELALPAWYLEPSDSEQSRLDTLAAEWGINLFPDDLEATAFQSWGVANLEEEVQRHQPAEDSFLVVLNMTGSGKSFPVVFVSPALKNKVEMPEVATADVFDHEIDAPANDRVFSTVPDAMSRLNNLPVVISVRLAEKKLMLGQVLALGPGALINFSKSCEDLLDMYVNNSLYCRGEAVKIGEHFGLKVNEIGVRPIREPKVLG